MTVAITANWVERDGTLTPYSKKFPDQAEVVLNAERRGIIKVAAHGLTHCVPGKHLPRWIGGNRRWHREHGALPGPARHQLQKDLAIPVPATSRPRSP